VVEEQEEVYVGFGGVLPAGLLMDQLEDLNFERRFAVAGPGLSLTDERRDSLDHEFDGDTDNLTSQLAEIDRLLAIK
jgi:hypothetical protein